MSGECNKCGEHTLDCACSLSRKKCNFLFTFLRSFFKDPYKSTYRNPDKYIDYLDNLYKKTYQESFTKDRRIRELEAERTRFNYITWIPIYEKLQEHEAMKDKLQWKKFKEMMPQGGKPIWFTKVNQPGVMFAPNGWAFSSSHHDSWCYCDIPEAPRKLHRAKNMDLIVQEQENGQFIACISGSNPIACQYCPLTGKKSSYQITGSIEIL